MKGFRAEYKCCAMMDFGIQDTGSNKEGELQGSEWPSDRAGIVEGRKRMRNWSTPWLG